MFLKLRSDFLRRTWPWWRIDIGMPGQFLKSWSFSPRSRQGLQSLSRLSRLAKQAAQRRASAETANASLSDGKCVQRIFETPTKAEEDPLERCEALRSIAKHCEVSSEITGSW